MKDIRLVALADGRILVFTRPQGEIGGRGKIGWLIVNQLSDLHTSLFNHGHILQQVNGEAWCGVNEAHLLSERLVGVLGHVARFDEAGNRHYHAAVFLFDVMSGHATPLRIISVRDDFSAGDYKRPDLQDVIFPGGLYQRDKRYRLFCGISDCEVHWREMDSPFGD